MTEGPIGARGLAPDWLAGVYDAHGPGLFRYALMILADHAAAEDVVQQVFARLARRPAAAPPIDAEARYLRRAVRHECFSRLRARRREATYRVDARRPLIEAADPRASRSDERLAIEAALDALPPEQREVVHLKVFDGRTFEEIAAITGVTINTAASRYRYALEKLRAALGSST